MTQDDQPLPTHRCTECGALWRFWPERDTGRPDSWSLRSAHAGPCCDTAPMGKQIVPLTWGELRRALAAPGEVVAWATVDGLRQLQEAAGAKEDMVNVCSHRSALFSVPLSASHAQALDMDACRLEPVAHELARRCLWIAYVWNDHNFDACHIYARQSAKKHGINSFEQAGRWLAALERKQAAGEIEQLRTALAIATGGAST